MVVVSAQDATRSVWCSAEDCANDAEPGSRLCTRCAKKDNVRLHKLPTINPNNELRCTQCGHFKPQAAFSFSRSASPLRHHRCFECKACAAQRRQRERAHLTPEQIEATRTRDRMRGRLYRQRQRAKRGQA